MAALRKRKVSRLWARRTFRTPKTVKKHKFICGGGPWKGHFLWLTTPNTLFFSTGAWCGRYIGSRGIYSSLVEWESTLPVQHVAGPAATDDVVAYS